MRTILTLAFCLSVPSSVSAKDDRRPPKTQKAEPRKPHKPPCRDDEWLDKDDKGVIWCKPMANTDPAG